MTPRPEVVHGCAALREGSEHKYMHQHMAATLDEIVTVGEREFTVRVRIDTPKEAEYFRTDGILQYVLSHLLTPIPSA